VLFVTAETAAGLVRGLTVGGIRQFRGIPYGAPTGGRNRFRAPQDPQAWSGVRDAFGYGDICPQGFTDPAHPFGLLIDWDLQPGGMSEDCLNLNIWTPGLRDGGDRPILLYLHGGGFNTGSANHYCFIGDRLARYGDAVVITVNHRLSAFGYLDLADLGAPEEFAEAGVAGMLDLVRALEWVRAHAWEFGGDAARVMIFGQSGGGRKVNFVQAMPAAKGLFHAAATQSGGTVRASGRDLAADYASRLLGVLGVDRDFSQLEKLTFSELLEAQIELGVYAQVMQPGAPVADAPNFSPVVDGVAIPQHPFDPGAPGCSADVPMLIGHCAHDAGWPYANFDLDEAGLRTVAADLAGDRAEEAMTLYGKAYPNDPPFLRQAAMLTDQRLGQDLTLQAERKSAQSGADVWRYRFDWRSPWAGGRFGAVHGMDMALVFHNTHQPTVCNSAEAQALADAMANIWLNFARTGNPNGSALPDWPAYDATGRATMLIDHPSPMCVSDPDRELRQFWAPGARS